ncbi:hypothetical protein GF322_01590 [Candidatus Dependentiae bacterium]|nr:hypothetical protein [Candidatus Dependentiae bacterium]
MNNLTPKLLINNKKNQIIFFSFLIFSLILLFLGIPYTKWYFKTDDFGNIYHCFIKSYKDIIKFVYEGNIEHASHACNDLHDQHFLGGLYRPMSFIYYLPQVFLFGTNAYGYFLITIILHALNSVLLFLIFTKIISPIFSFLFTMYFAFHPTLIWLGWISAQTYFTEFLTLIFLLFFLKKYLDTNQIKFYLFSCVLFLMNIYLKEQTIVLPIWIIWATYIYKTFKLNSQKSVFTKLKVSLILSSGYWLIIFFYLFTRALIFPIRVINTNTPTSLTFALNLHSFLNRQKERFFDFVTYIADFLNLSLLPKNHQIIKGSLIIILIIFLFILFINSKNKIISLFLLFSILLFSWPALLIHYQPRYIYISLAFFILLIIFLLKSQKSTNLFAKYKKTIMCILSLTICINATYLTIQLTAKEKLLNHIKISLMNLIKKDELQNAITNNHALCFYNLPYYFRQGTAQATWMLTNKSNYPIYVYLTKPPISTIYKLGYNHIPNPKTVNKNILYITWDYDKSEFIFDY